jgi:hypothetical protein
MSRPIEGEPNHILNAAESIISEAKDFNRTYPTTLKFRTAEKFRDEVAMFTAARRGLRNIAEAAERGEEVPPLLAIADGFAKSESGQGIIPTSEQQRKNDAEYVAENLLPRLLEAIPFQRKTTGEIFREQLAHMQTGTDPEADRTIIVHLSEREVEFLKGKARSSIKARESTDQILGKPRKPDDSYLQEDHIKELEKAFELAQNEDTENS